MSQIAKILDQLGKKRNAKVVNNLLDHSQCHICHELLTVPMMLTCGHNYCYLCLKNWFTVNESKKLGCPDCRMDVENIPQWNLFVDQQIKFVVELIMIDFKDDQKSSSAVSTYWNKLNNDRINDSKQYEIDKKQDKLFDNVFKNSTLSVVDMDDDGIARCGNCHWEIDPDDMVDDDDNVCPHCHYRIRNRVISGNSNSTRDDETSNNNNDGSSNSIRQIRGNRVNVDEYSEGEYEEIVDEIQQYNDSDLDSDDSDIANIGNGNVAVDDEAREAEDDEEYDEDKAYGLKSRDMKRKMEEIEIELELDDVENDYDSDLDSFIERDDEEEEEEEEGNFDEDQDKVVHRKRKYATIQDDEETDKSSSDSEFYENQSDSFASGDSLADEDEDDTVATIDVQRFSESGSKPTVVSLDDSDDDILEEVAHLARNQTDGEPSSRRRRANALLSSDED